MILLKNIDILAKHTMYRASLGNCSSTTAPALSYYRPSMDICIALLPAFHGSIYSFWKNLSGPMFNLFWDQFACNHSLCTGSTVVGQCMEQLPNGYAFRRIGQTDSLTDLIKHNPIVCIPMKYPGQGLLTGPNIAPNLTSTALKKVSVKSARYQYPDHQTLLLSGQFSYPVQ